MSDILKSRVQKPTGIAAECFTWEGANCEIYDVSGQKHTERKKWIHCFSDKIFAVVFVASLSDYDQMMLDDPTQNRMVEAIELFDEICNLACFEKIGMILLLNKADLFEKKIKKVMTGLPRISILLWNVIANGISPYIYVFI